MARGNKPNGDLWKIGIEKPAENKNDARIVQEIIELKDKSIVTSGNYRKYVEQDGKRYSHSLNPMTGYPSGHTAPTEAVHLCQLPIQRNGRMGKSVTGNHTDYVGNPGTCPCKENVNVFHMNVHNLSALYGQYNR